MGKDSYDGSHIDQQGAVTLPKGIREKLGLKAGSKLDFELLRAVLPSYALPT